MLEQFENTKFIQKIRTAPRETSTYPVESKAFATFIHKFFISSSPLIANDLDKIQIRRIPKFQIEELDIALQGMTNLKGADEYDIVIEIVKHATRTFKENLISWFNQTLLDASFEESLYITILHMPPEDGDLNEFTLATYRYAPDFL